MNGNHSTRRDILCGLVAGLMCAAPACAAAGSLTPILTCRSITDPTTRLGCFDRESARLVTSAVPSTTAPAPPPPAPAVAPAPANTADSKANFGLSEVAVEEKEVAAGKRTADPTSMEARIDHVGSAGGGLVIFQLDNGQVWRQVASEGDLLAKPGDVVKISRAMFGSYYLQLKSGRGCKVRRVS